MSLREKFHTLLSNVSEKIGSQIQAIIITDKDGLVIASITTSLFEDKILGGISGVVQPALKRIQSEYGGNKQNGLGTFSTNHAQLIFCEAGEGAMVIIVGTLLASVDFLVPYCYLIAEKTVQILREEPTSMNIPYFYQEANLKKQLLNPENLNKPNMRYPLKIILTGDSGVGKTSIVNQFVNQRFYPDFRETIGISLMNKSIQLTNWKVQLDFLIYDLGGQEVFTKVRRTYMLGATAGLIVFDLTQPATFEHVAKWYEECKQAESQMLIMLIGNKKDLNQQRKISTIQGKKLATDLGISYFETTATAFDSVLAAFQVIGNLMMAQLKSLAPKMIQVNPS